MDNDSDHQGSTQAFFTVLIGLPLALWGGYSLIRDLIESQETPARKTAPFRRRPQPKPTEPKPPIALDKPVLSDEPVEQEEENIDEVMGTAAAGDGVDGEGVEDGGHGVDEEAPPEIPIHPEILYAQSIELSDPLPDADQGPKNAFVIEATPVGLVAMGYDFENKRWIYWANLTPHFRVLDAVARVYANTHNRHDLYIPPAVADAANKATEKEAAKKQEGEGAVPEKIAEDNKASLFINPTPVGSGEISRPDTQHVANCFKRKGMLSELTFIPEGPREPPKRTSYADFLAKGAQTAKFRVNVSGTS